VGVCENRVSRVFGPKREEVVEAGEDCIMRRFMRCFITKYYSSD